MTGSPDSPFRDLDALKAAARQRATARRLGADPALGAVLAERLLAEMPPPPSAVIAGYSAIRDEIEISFLLAELHRRGHDIGLPQTPPRGQPLVFRRWTPGDPLVPGRFGTCHPEGPPLVPDLLLVPLLAFDRRGVRLGYGAGYYDRTLAGLPAAQAIGCAYAAQEVAQVPAGPHDIRLAAIATEHGVIHCDDSR